MKNFYDIWKKHLIKEGDMGIGQPSQTDTQGMDASAIAAQAQEKNAEEEKKKKQQIDLITAQMKAKQNELKALKDQLMKLKSKGEQLNFAGMEEAKGYGFGGQSEGSVGAPVSVQQEELTEEELEEACGQHEGIEEGGRSCELELEYDELEEEKPCGQCKKCMSENLLSEAKYKGRSVTLNKPMRGDVKKFKVFVRDPSTGNIKKVNFGDKKMRIKKNNPKRRKSFRARHRCSNPGPKTKARYWSCRKW